MAIPPEMRILAPRMQTGVLVMGIEATFLGWSVILGLVIIAIAASASVAQRGLGWAAGPRDRTPPPLAGIAGRLDRARHNFLETFPLFATVVLAVLVLDRQDALSAIGVQLYFWARVAHVLVYAAGVAYLRTLIWAVSIAGIVCLLVSLL